MDYGPSNVPRKLWNCLMTMTVNGEQARNGPVQESCTQNHFNYRMRSVLSSNSLCGGQRAIELAS